jgi:hypothetical protein
MSTVITSGSETIEPTIIDGYSSGRESRNIVHPILGRSEPDVTLRPANLRTGTLTLGFEGPTSEIDSLEAETLHATGGVFAVVSTDRGTVEMSYVVNGQISRTLEDETRDAWLVTVDYQEVTA